MPATEAGAIRIARLSPHEPAALHLLAAADALFGSLYPATSNHLEPPDALAQAHVAFFGAWLVDELVGCGAVKAMRDDGVYGEIKRVFVIPAMRGRGIAKVLMGALEAHARDAGLAVVRLETGMAQPAALALYEGLGYRLRPPFGAYREDPFSVYMEKALLR